MQEEGTHTSKIYRWDVPLCLLSLFLTSRKATLTLLKTDRDTGPTSFTGWSKKTLSLLDQQKKTSCSLRWTYGPRLLHSYWLAQRHRASLLHWQLIETKDTPFFPVTEAWFIRVHLFRSCLYWCLLKKCALDWCVACHINQHSEVGRRTALAVTELFTPEDNWWQHYLEICLALP